MDIEYLMHVVTDIVSPYVYRQHFLHFSFTNFIFIIHKSKERLEVVVVIDFFHWHQFL